MAQRMSKQSIQANGKFPKKYLTRKIFLGSRWFYFYQTGFPDWLFWTNHQSGSSNG